MGFGLEVDMAIVSSPARSMLPVMWSTHEAFSFYFAGAEQRVGQQFAVRFSCIFFCEYAMRSADDALKTTISYLTSNLRISRQTLTSGMSGVSSVMISHEMGVIEEKTIRRAAITVGSVELHTTNLVIIK